MYNISSLLFFTSSHYRLVFSYPSREGCLSHMYSGMLSVTWTEMNSQTVSDVTTRGSINTASVLYAQEANKVIGWETTRHSITVIASYIDLSFPKAELASHNEILCDIQYEPIHTLKEPFSQPLCNILRATPSLPIPHLLERTWTYALAAALWTPTYCSAHRARQPTRTETTHRRAQDTSKFTQHMQTVLANVCSNLSHSKRPKLKITHRLFFVNFGERDGPSRPRSRRVNPLPQIRYKASPTMLSSI